MNVLLTNLMLLRSTLHIGYVLLKVTFTISRVFIQNKRYGKDSEVQKNKSVNRQVITDYRMLQQISLFLKCRMMN